MLYSNKFTDQFFIVRAEAGRSIQLPQKPKHEDAVYHTKQREIHILNVMIEYLL